MFMYNLFLSYYTVQLYYKGYKMNNQKQTRIEKIYSYNPSELELHPLAESTPRMTNENYTALKADIEMNGQLDPVILYRGRIIDGRHRKLILQELGSETITAVKLPATVSAERLRSIVRSKETRRHETPTQLAITAYRMMVNSDSKVTAQVAAETVGADRRKVGNAKNIATKYGRIDILDLLYDGGKVNVGSDYEPFNTDSLPAILNWLKSISKKEKQIDVRGKVEMTEEQFTKCNSIVSDLIKLDTKMIKHISGKLYYYIKEQEEILAESKDCK